MRTILVLAVGIALLLPGAALAQGSSSCQGYNQPAVCASTANRSGGPGGGGTGGTQAGSLPFTGLDVGLLVVGGGTLLGAGLVMRRLSRRLD